MNNKLLRFLLAPSSYPHPCDKVIHLETHISHIFLSGAFAYKIKKAIVLDFLDFTSLEKRKYFCEREVLLNKRFAKDLYLEVIAISANKQGLFFDEDGKVIEYAVKMKRLDNRGLFTELLEDNKLTRELLAKITVDIASFHRKEKSIQNHWSIEQIESLIQDNIHTLSQYSGKIITDDSFQSVHVLIKKELQKKSDIISTRQLSSVKFLHGDLHLKNIALYQGEPILFDGIEFNDELACCDVWADVAFLIMDLRFRGREDLANLVSNIYLEENDDFQGLQLLKLYQAYRAMVRAKISCLEFDNVMDHKQKEEAKKSAAKYFNLAQDLLKPAKPLIIGIGGLSGTGKTSIARALAEKIDAVHIRSDVVRKHHLGLRPLEHAGVSAYSQELNEVIYSELRFRAQAAVEAGYSVIVDAVHLSLHERRRLEALALSLKCPFVGIWCSIPLELAKERVRSRLHDASDADESVVEKQYHSSIEGLSWQILDTSYTIPSLIDTLLAKYKLVSANKGDACAIA